MAWFSRLLLLSQVRWSDFVSLASGRCCDFCKVRSPDEEENYDNSRCFCKTSQQLNSLFCWDVTQFLALLGVISSQALHWSHLLYIVCWQVCRAAVRDWDKNWVNRYGNNLAFPLLYMYVCWYTCVMAHVWRSEGSFSTWFCPTMWAPELEFSHQAFSCWATSQALEQASTKDSSVDVPVTCVSTIL